MYIALQFRGHTFRIDQNSQTFPWPKFKFPWQYQSRKFYKFSKKNTSGPNTLASSDWTVNFPDIFCKLHFSLTHHRIPWQCPDLEKKKKKSLTFPWHVWTLCNIWHQPEDIYILFSLLFWENVCFGYLLKLHIQSDFTTYEYHNTHFHGEIRNYFSMCCIVILINCLQVTEQCHCSHDVIRVRHTGHLKTIKWHPKRL